MFLHFKYIFFAFLILSNVLNFDFDCLLNFHFRRMSRRTIA